MSLSVAFPRVIRAMEGSSRGVAKMSSLVLRAPERQLFSTVSKVVDGTPATGFKTAQEALDLATQQDVRRSVSIAVRQGDGALAHYPMELGGALHTRRGFSMAPKIHESSAYMPHVSGTQQRVVNAPGIDLSKAKYDQYAHGWVSSKVTVRDAGEVHAINGSRALSRLSRRDFDSMLPRTQDALVGAAVAGGGLAAGGIYHATRNGDDTPPEGSTDTKDRTPGGDSKHGSGASVPGVLLLGGGLFAGAAGAVSARPGVAYLGLAGVAIGGLMLLADG